MERLLSVCLLWWLGVNDARSIYEKLLKLDTEKRLRTTFHPLPTLLYVSCNQSKVLPLFNTFDLLVLTV